MERKKTLINHLPWIAPILLFAAFAPFTPFLDIYVSSLYFTPASVGKGIFYDNAFFAFLFHYGEFFALGVGIIAGVVFLLSFLYPLWQKWRRPALLFGATMVIGAGGLVNLCLKEHWGRPRPKEIVEFGGKHTYHPFWQPDRATHQKSFPSGHVAMGFSFIALCVAAKREKSRILFFFGLGFTLFWGIGLMAARVVQGGHFVSDVVASILLMWLVAYFLDQIFSKIRESSL